ncbi:DUF6286 domain-containing protein [Terrabacter terrigena]|uniref:DUF6286 domain-containing protein n=1 Tax=Terrabacter terrigena TaxID=574718 RepID=A0ABW3MZF7_9MICO
MSGYGGNVQGAMPPAKTPRRTGVVGALGILLALLLTASGALAVRDALVYGRVLSGSAFVHDLAHVLQGLRPQAWVLVVGIVLALVGLVLLVTALRPSVVKATAVAAETGVFLGPRDVSRLVETAAEDVDGVLGVRVSSTPRRVTVDVRSTGDQRVEERVRDAVTARLAPLENQPTVRVRIERPRR